MEKFLPSQTYCYGKKVPLLWQLLNKFKYSKSLQIWVAVSCLHLCINVARTFALH